MRNNFHEEALKMQKMWDDYNSMKEKTEDILECYVQKFMENDDREANKCKQKFIRKYGKKSWHYY